MRRRRYNNERQSHRSGRYNGLSNHPPPIPVPPSPLTISSPPFPIENTPRSEYTTEPHESHVHQEQREDYTSAHYNDGTHPRSDEPWLDDTWNNNVCAELGRIHFFHLSGRCTFIYFPELPWYEDRRPNYLSALERDSLVKIFFGHTRYNLNRGVIEWLVRTISGVIPVFVEAMYKQPSARFYVYVQSEIEKEIIIACMNKRVLFDECGVWWAQTTAELFEMAVFLAYVRPAFIPKVPLPMSSMVAESSKYYENHT
eukprot:PhF_6_TR43148/c0_g1_i2/m.66041